MEKQQEPDVQKGILALQTFQLIPPKQQRNSWVSSLRKSGKFSNTSSIKIFLQEDSLQYSKRFLHSQPVHSLRSTQQNASSIMRNTTLTIRHILKSNYQKLIQQFSNKQQKFTDSQFRPTKESIGGNWPDFEWKRIPQIIQNPQFIKEIIQPSDVLQGQIGDCYFLSAIAALAQNDYRIKNIFPCHQIQKNGIYMARILHQGILRQVVVDDYIPVKKDGKPVFAKPSGGKQIWVMILQKCWAKLYKSYHAITDGVPHQVLHAFSGAPTYYYPMPEQVKQKTQLFQKIFNAQQNGGILCCGTKSNPILEEKGLIKGHAYTILGIYKTPCKLLKIRNPWGKIQWNGRGSEKDKAFWSTLSNQFKSNIGFYQNSQSGEDGIFFMFWQDFTQLFEMIDLCMINDNASYLCSTSILSHKNGRYFEFNLSENSNITIALSQKSLRGKSQQQIKKGYSKSTLILAKYCIVNQKLEYKFIKCSQNFHFPDHYLDVHDLNSGSYVIFAKVDWNDKKQHTATVSIYTQAKLFLKQVKLQTHKQFLYKTFLNHARRNLKRRQIIKQEPLQWICNDFLANHGSYGYAAYHLDKNSKYKLIIEFDQQDFKRQNLVLKKPYKGQGKIKTKVKPGQQLIILFRLRAYPYIQKVVIPVPVVYKQY